MSDQGGQPSEQRIAQIRAQYAYLASEQMPANGEHIRDLFLALDAAQARVWELQSALSLAIDDFDWAGSMYDGVLGYLHVHGIHMTEEQIERAKVAQEHKSAAQALLQPAAAEAAGERTVAGSLAMQSVQERLKNGGDVEIPSLGIVIKGEAAGEEGR